MVSRLIEARPEDMRSYLEEAAGISATTRIAGGKRNCGSEHTRENLERLSDLREEVGRQLTHLEKQSQLAEKVQRAEAARAPGSVPSWVALKLRAIDAEMAKEQHVLARAAQCCRGGHCRSAPREAARSSARASQDRAQRSARPRCRELLQARRGSRTPRTGDPAQPRPVASQRQRVAAAARRGRAGPGRAPRSRPRPARAADAHALTGMDPRAGRRARCAISLRGPASPGGAASSHSGRRDWDALLARAGAGETGRSRSNEAAYQEHLEDHSAQRSSMTTRRSCIVTARPRLGASSSPRWKRSGPRPPAERRSARSAAGRAAALEERASAQRVTGLASAGDELHQARSALQALRGRRASLEALQQAHFGPQRRQRERSGWRANGLEQRPSSRAGAGGCPGLGTCGGDRARNLSRSGLRRQESTRHSGSSPAGPRHRRRSRSSTRRLRPEAEDSRAARPLPRLLEQAQARGYLDGLFPGVRVSGGH